MSVSFGGNKGYCVARIARMQGCDVIFETKQLALKSYPETKRAKSETSWLKTEENLSLRALNMIHQITLKDMVMGLIQMCRIRSNETSIDRSRRVELCVKMADLDVKRFSRPTFFSKSSFQF